MLRVSVVQVQAIYCMLGISSWLVMLGLKKKKKNALAHLPISDRLRQVSIPAFFHQLSAKMDTNRWLT